MNCPNCSDHKLKPTLTKQGVEVDYCKKCRGIWLDEGEIFHFTRNRKGLEEAFKVAEKAVKPSPKLSPKTGEAMEEIPFLEGELVLDVCPKTKGIWFDKGELNKLVKTDPKLLSVKIDDAAKDVLEEEEGVEKPPPRVPPGPLSKLPNLAFRSTVTVLSLYALVTLVLILSVEFAGLPPWFALAIGIGIATIQFVLGPWLMDISLRWFYKMKWVKLEQLPAHLKQFTVNLCSNVGMKVPRFGLINDGAPNAFTYGHRPNNARVVITRGILNLLNEKEVEAVVAHEVGHARHWDMFWMTVAQLVPLILYYIFRTMMRTGRGSRDGGDVRDPLSAMISGQRSSVRYCAFL